MLISFACHACHHAIEVAPSYAGHRGPCPRCGTLIQVPEFKAPPPSAPPVQRTLADVAPPAQPSGQESRPDVAVVRERWRSAYGLGDERSLDPRLSTKHVDPAGQRGSASDASRASIQEPRNRFELGEVLGQGGMGIVYRARQGKLKRDVAVKKLLLEQAKEASRAAFIAESLVTAWLDHPNIVPIYDLTESAKGEVELAMKIVGGTSWNDLLHPQSPSHEGRAAKYELVGHLGILLAVCNAVSFAHSRGIAHLDLKPDNVMVGDFGEVLVMDWGLALDIRAQPVGERRARLRSEMTNPSGTPSYMAPELAEGDGAAVGPGTDVYLLGAILYEILTRRPPHVGASFFEVIINAITSEPPEFEASVPQELQEICRRAMAQRPQDRYEGVDAFRGAIEGFLAHRESLLVSARALESLVASRRRLAKTSSKRAVPESERNEIYDGFAQAIAGCTQAALLWAGNTEAQEGARQARLEFGQAALANGDLGLAQAQAAKLDGALGEAEDLRCAVDEAVAARTAELRANRRMRWALRLGALAFMAASLIALLWIRSEQQATKIEAERAKKSADKADKNAAAARASEQRAQESLLEIQRIADGVPARDLLEEAGALWPGSSEQLPRLEAWLKNSQGLLARLGGHRDFLQAVKAARAAGSDERRVRILEIVVRDFEALLKVVPDIEGRRDWARQVRAQTLEGEAAALWRRAVASIADDCPVYQGLRLAPIEGFVPLARDPESGLWEFWQPRSGDRPEQVGDRLVLGESSGLVFVLIPGGRFNMGAIKGPAGRPNQDPNAAGDEGPVHEVTLPPFLMSKYEVTQGQWLRLMGKNPSYYAPGDAGGFGLSLRHPVESVSWSECADFARRLGLRLPSESEWEYAARAGTTTVYWTGDEKETLAGRSGGAPAANVGDQSNRKAGGQADVEAWDDGFPLHAPVGSVRPNPWGLFDILGNVQEWCEDDYIAGYTQAPVDGRAYVQSPRASERGKRGGAWTFKAPFARSADRYGVEAGSRLSALGVRLGRGI